MQIIITKRASVFQALTARLQPLARSRGEHDGTRKQRARARSEVGLLPAWPPGAMRRFDLAIATSFQLPAGRSRGCCDCGGWKQWRERRQQS